MSISCLLQNLQVPSLQPDSRYSEGHSELEQDPQLQKWKIETLNVLTNLNDLLAHGPVILADNDVASIVSIAIPLDSDDVWASELIRATSKEIMATLPSPTLVVVSRVLSHHIKPIFQKTPHPRINSSSGRKLSRPAGGPSSAQDFYGDQEWKTQPGVAYLLRWCVQHLKSEDYESVWHLVIPPTMVLLDDYEIYHKLRGVEVVSELLHHVPPEALKRTGVDGLLISSLRSGLLHLHTPLSPRLLRMSIPALLTVLNLTTPVGSKARFDQICTLLGDNIIGEVWVFASEEQETIEASMAVLPHVLRELGSGSIRYLKTLLAQIFHNLIPPPLQKRSASLQIVSLEVLEVAIQVCRPRISVWKGPIVEALARSWVYLQDKDTLHETDRMALQSALRRVSLVLSETCPSVRQDEYQHLLACDETMFRGLLSTDLTFNSRDKR